MNNGLGEESERASGRPGQFCAIGIIMSCLFTFLSNAPLLPTKQQSVHFETTKPHYANRHADGKENKAKRKIYNLIVKVMENCSVINLHCHGAEHADSSSFVNWWASFAFITAKGPRHRVSARTLPKKTNQLIMRNDEWEWLMSSPLINESDRGVFMTRSHHAENSFELRGKLL